MYVIRHGETDCNRDGIIQGPRVDSELSDRGHVQAERLGQAFSATRLDAIFVSPMLRARQTAHALTTAGQQAAIQVVPELYEMDFGSLCGRPVDEHREVMTEMDHAWSAGFVDRPWPGGESPLLVQHRLRTFMERLRASQGHVAVVAHGRVNRVLVASLLGQGLQMMEHYPQANAAITHVEPPRVHRVNDIAHLT